MKKQDFPKTAFTTDNGHFEYVRMPFGLTSEEYPDFGVS